MLFRRSKKLERDLQTTRWKINFEDITITHRTQSQSSKVRTFKNDVKIMYTRKCVISVIVRIKAYLGFIMQ